MKFGLYFLGEYAHMIVACSVAIVLFFGGWHLPFITSDASTLGAALIRVGVFIVKLWVFIAFYMWVRWTLPRFRFDQIMSLAWRAGVPLGLALLLLNSIVVYFYPAGSAAALWWQLVANIGVLLAVLIILGISKPKLARENIPIVMDAE